LKERIDDLVVATGKKICMQIADASQTGRLLPWHIPVGCSSSDLDVGDGDGSANETAGRFRLILAAGWSSRGSICPDILVYS
jgi:hypothetical protein